MSYPVNKIIPFNVTFKSAGLGFANFGKLVLFAPESELPSGFTVDTKRTYSSLKGASVDFASTTETYKALNRWLGGTPNISDVTVYARADADNNWTDTLNKVRNKFWWYYSIFTKSVYANLADVKLIAAWHHTSTRYFINCQTGANCVAIRDENISNDIVTELNDLGYRRASTFAHATDPYAGISLLKWFAKVNYSQTNSTISGDYKKLYGVVAEDLTESEYNAMITKKCGFYSIVELNGEFDNGRVINSWTHSANGEMMDDVINTDAFVNHITVALYNSIATQPTKLGQDPIGQSILIGNARREGRQFIDNGFLGARNYIDPDDGISKYTEGFEILTQPEDILNLSDPDRAAHKAAPLRIRIFRKGSILTCATDLEIY